MNLVEYTLRLVGLLLVIGGVGLSFTHRAAPAETHLLLYFGLLLMTLASVSYSRRLKRRVRELETQLGRPAAHA